jgi:hypothetical protein
MAATMKTRVAARLRSATGSQGGGQVVDADDQRNESDA